MRYLLISIIFLANFLICQAEVAFTKADTAYIFGNFAIGVVAIDSYKAEDEREESVRRVIGNINKMLGLKKFSVNMVDEVSVFFEKYFLKDKASRYCMVAVNIDRYNKYIKKHFKSDYRIKKKRRL